FSSGAENGINILFGSEQYYVFTLKYHVNNPSISQGISQIALPPDTSFQKIVYTSIDPKPDKIESDTDGNWIATYTIEAQKELTVTATGVATIYLKPTVQVSVVKPDSVYLQEKLYWETSNPEVQRLAKELKTPRAIYDYLVRTYSYDYSRLAMADQRRRGAAATLQSKTDALCQEFTDSFIAIARAAGIPARELNGFAYTENPRLRPLSLVGDLLHAWPEYYDAQKKLWIPIDPTWGNTTGGVDFFSKLDFNHLVFAIHGVSSEKPYPAGVYKIQGKEGRDVEVKLSSIGQEVARLLSVSAPTMLRPNTVTVRNLTGSSWYDIPIFLRSQPVLRFTNKTPSTVTLLPFEQREVEVSAYSTNWISKQKGSVTITIGDESVQYETTTGSIDIGLAVGIGFGLSVVAAGCVLVFGSRFKRAVRR
ncbi:MAG TPA: transglutaminase family protein, partial [Patescibacteria group bacterium]|nr:transglutaminase family protein [Patescibacteria group bacterium]